MTSNHGGPHDFQSGGFSYETAYCVFLEVPVASTYAPRLVGKSSDLSIQPKGDWETPEAL